MLVITSDVIDWYGGLAFNRGEFARARGVACSASEEFEYEESLQFSTVSILYAHTQILRYRKHLAESLLC